MYSQSCTNLLTIAAFKSDLSHQKHYYSQISGQPESLAHCKCFYIGMKCWHTIPRNLYSFPSNFLSMNLLYFLPSNLLKPLSQRKAANKKNKPCRINVCTTACCETLRKNILECILVLLVKQGTSQKRSQGISQIRTRGIPVLCCHEQNCPSQTKYQPHKTC